MSGSSRETFAYARPARPDDGEAALGDCYLEAIAKLEALPRNQSGADKTWIEDAIRDWERHYRLAVRLR